MFRVVQFICVCVFSLLAFEHIFDMPISEMIIDISHDVQQQFRVVGSGQTGIIIIDNVK